MGKVIFIDNKGRSVQTEVSDFCKLTLSIQNGQVTSVDHHESIKMKPMIDLKNSVKNVAKTHENIAKTLI